MNDTGSRAKALFRGMFGAPREPREATPGQCSTAEARAALHHLMRFTTGAGAENWIPIDALWRQYSAFWDSRHAHLARHRFNAALDHLAQDGRIELQGQHVRLTPPNA